MAPFLMEAKSQARARMDEANKNISKAEQSRAHLYPAMSIQQQHIRDLRGSFDNMVKYMAGLPPNSKTRMADEGFERLIEDVCQTQAALHRAREELSDATNDFFGLYSPPNLKSTRSRPKPEPKPESKPKSKPTPKQRAHEPQPEPSHIEAWRTRVNICFADYTKMQAFPSPPQTTSCQNQACKTSSTKLLVCKCSVVAAFKKVLGLDLKKERTAWHPGRFSACHEEHREKFKEMAQEVFVVVDRMY